LWHYLKPNYPNNNNVLYKNNNNNNLLYKTKNFDLNRKERIDRQNIARNIGDTINDDDLVTIKAKENMYGIVISMNSNNCNLKIVNNQIEILKLLNTSDYLNSMFLSKKIINFQNLKK